MASPDRAMHTRSSFLDIVKITVGEERNETAFLIHKSLLIHKSEYFMKALDGNWEEATKGAVKFEDIDPEDFQVFAEWLFVGEQAIAEPATGSATCNKARVLTQQSGCDDLQGEDDTACFACNFHRAYELLRFYVLGDRLMSSDFKNAVVSNLIQLYGKQGTSFSPSSDFVNMAYELTTPKSPFRRVLVDFQAQCAPPVAFGPQAKWPPLHVLAVARKALSCRGYPTVLPNLENACERYHEHSKGSPRSLAKKRTVICNDE